MYPFHPPVFRLLRCSIYSTRLSREHIGLNIEGVQNILFGQQSFQIQAVGEQGSLTGFRSKRIIVHLLVFVNI